MRSRTDIALSLFLTAALTGAAVLLYSAGGPQVFAAGPDAPRPLISPDVATGTTIGAGLLQAAHTLRLLLRKAPS